MWPGTSGGHGLSTQSSVCRAFIGCFGAAIVGLIEIDTESLAIVHYPHKPAPRGVPKVGIESLQPTSITTSAAAYLRLHGFKGTKPPKHSRVELLNSCAQLYAFIRKIDPDDAAHEHCLKWIRHDPDHTIAAFIHLGSLQDSSFVRQLEPCAQFIAYVLFICFMSVTTLLRCSIYAIFQS